MTEPDYAALMPFAVTLGIRVTAASADEVVADMQWAPALTTAGGALHGGALMALADSTAAVCAFLNLPDGAATATTSSNTVFLRGVRSGTVNATARPVHVGRSSIVLVTEVRDSESKLVAQVTQTQAVLVG